MIYHSNLKRIKYNYNLLNDLWSLAGLKALLNLKGLKLKFLRWGNKISLCHCKIVKNNENL